MSEPRKILVTNFHPKGGGGHVTYIMDLLSMTDSDSLTIAVATPESSRLYRRLSQMNYPHLYPCDFPAKLKELRAVIAAVKSLRGIVKDFSPDIVHTNGGADLSVCLWALLLDKKIKLVRTHHGIKGLGGDFYHQWMYRRRVASNIYVSMTSMLLNHASGLKPKHCRVIPNGVDLDRFKPRQKDANILKELNIAPDSFVFGTCAGLGGYKRVDVFLKAASHLKDKNFKIVCLGDPSQGQRLEAFAGELGLQNHFIYAGFKDDVMPYVSVFDVGFIMSDNIETISYAAREMMAMGKPLISSNFSGLRENVAHGLNGFLVDPGDVEQTRHKIQAFLEMSPEECFRFSENARRFAESSFSRLDALSKHRQLYESL